MRSICSPGSHGGSVIERHHDEPENGNQHHDGGDGQGMGEECSGWPRRAWRARYAPIG